MGGPRSLTGCRLWGDGARWGGVARLSQKSRTWKSIKAVARAVPTISCIIVLAVPLQPQPDLNGTVPAGRMLKSGGSVIGVSAGVYGSLAYPRADRVYIGDDYESSGILWLTLFGATFMMMMYLAFKLFTPFERLNIFMLSVVKMLQRDLMVFLVLFGFFMLDFYFALFILYPRAGNVFMPQVTPFNSWYNALRSLFELAFTGSPAMIDLEVDFTSLSSAQVMLSCVWACGPSMGPQSAPHMYM